DGIRDKLVTGVQTCALPIYYAGRNHGERGEMRAVVYSKTGGPDVLQLVERPIREPGAGGVRVRVQVSGVNPTDWKARRGAHEGRSEERRVGREGRGWCGGVE